MRLAPSIRYLLAFSFIVLTTGFARTRWQADTRAGAEAERERWQSVAEIFDLLALQKGHQVADVGAGSGFFTVRLAGAVGNKGRVFAVDVSEKVVAELRQRIQESGLANVEVILGEADNPKLPSGLDSALIVDAYHEMQKHDTILEHIHRALKPGGLLMVIEPFSKTRRSSRREEQQTNHEIAPELVEADLRNAGFEVVARNDEFVEHRAAGTIQAFVLARRPR